MQWKSRTENRRARLLIVAPFMATALAALTLAVSAVAASGAAEEFGYPDWAPTAGGLLFAVPTFCAAAFYARAVWLRTYGPFRLRFLRLAPGTAAVLGGFVLTAAYAVVVGDPDTYRGEFDRNTGEWNPMYSLESFLGLTLLVATVFPMAGVWFFAKVAYLDAIEPLGLEEVEGPDPMGQMIREASQR